MSSVFGFFCGFIVEKEKNFDEYLMFVIVNGKIDGKLLMDDEKIGIIWFFWLGGFDIVVVIIS